MVEGSDGKPPFELIPDNVFGIEGPRGINFFALECERTNSVDSKNNTSATGKMRGYMAVSRYVNGKPLYRHKWELPNLQVIFLKDTQNKVDNLKAAFAKFRSEGSAQFLFNTFPTMKTLPPYFSPKPLPQMFTGSWQRVGHENQQLAK